MPAINTGEDNQTDRDLHREGRRMTVLTREESVRDFECARGLECYSPARVAVCRLLAVVAKCKGRKKDKCTVKEVVKREVDREMSVAVDRLGNGGGGVDSGNQRQEMTFNITAGLGLLSLIAATKTELNKTTELRKEMEVFLRRVKQEGDNRKVRNKPKQTESECTYAVSTTVDGLSNHSQEESGISFTCDKHCNDMCHAEECVVDGVNHLEEEFTAELEQLQLDIGTVDASENQEITEVSSNEISCGDVINPIEPVTPEHSGVPPLELERRLHELLEARQEERIRELEAHLKYMKEKLQEKEVEVIWWKDTAKLISKQVPESSRAKVICGD